MFTAKLLVLLLPLLGAAFAERTRKPVRAAAVADPQPTPAASQVPNYDPAPYNAVFQPENLDLTGFFGPQFINTKQHHGVDLNSLYAQFGSPHQHFAFTVPSNKGAKQPNLQLQRQPSPLEYIYKKQRVPQGPQQIEVPIPAANPNKQASEEAGHYFAQAHPAYAQQAPAYLQAPAYAQGSQYAQQPAYAHVAQQHPGVPAQPQYQYVSPQVVEYAPRPQQQAFAPVYAPHHHQIEAARPPAQPVVALKQQARPTVASHYQTAFQPSQAVSSAQSPSYSNHFQYAQPQSESFQAPAGPVQLAAAGKQPKVDIQAVIQSQVLPQLKDAEGIQLLDLSLFYPQKQGQPQTFYQVHPSSDFKTASFTPVQLSSFYQTAGGQQPQSAKTSSSIPAAAIREPTLSADELSNLLHHQQGAVQPNYAQSAPSQQPPRPSSYAQFSPPIKAHGPSRQQPQQQIDLSAYYAQLQGQRPASADIVYGQQYAVHDAPQPQSGVYYAQQPSAEPTEEIYPVKSSSNDAQFFKSTVAKPVKRGPKPTQLAHIASPLPSPTPNPTASSKPQKIRQLVKKPHSYGHGYSFELSG